MNLLIITRKIDQNDERAGFFMDWIFEFTKHLDKLYVICQELGNINSLPKNVEIYSLGKEKNNGRFKQFILLNCYIVRLLKRADGVFSHMMPVYSVVAGPWCKIYRKKLVQWYMHKKVPLMLRLANFWVDAFVTASPESFRMRTRKKVNIFGHGINLEKFKIYDLRFKNKNKFVILSVGRISPVKNIDLIVKTAEYIKLNEPELREKISVQIIGGPALVADATYLEELEKEVTEKNLNSLIDFLGPLPQKETVSYYQNCDLFINLSGTGSLDKAVLEAMAAGALVLTSNEAFKDILPEKLFLKEKTPEMLAERIKEIYEMPLAEKEKYQKGLQNEVGEKHNLEKLVAKIITLFN